jgi:hypothetical protein
MIEVNEPPVSRCRRFIFMRGAGGLRRDEIGRTGMSSVFEVG